jgi:replicative DNA helicase
MSATAPAIKDIDGLPNCAELEQVVLGASVLRIDIARDIVERLAASDFYQEPHRLIFAAIKSLLRKGSEITPSLICEEIRQNNSVGLLNGISFVTNLVTICLPLPATLDHSITRIKESAARREAIKACAAFTERAKDGSALWSASVEWAKKRISDLEVVQNSSLLQSWREVRALHLPEGDQIIHELERGELGLLNAVTNVGKSTLIRNLILSLACGRPFANIAPLRKPRRVVLLDFESRLRRLQKDTDKMLQVFSDHERALIDENLQIVCDCQTNDEPLSLSTDQHMARLTRDIRAWHADLIIVDTITAAFNVKDENSNSEVANVILKPLIRMARETQSAIIAAHHVGKGGEEGRTQERAYRGRGASAFGTFPSLVLDIVADSTDRDRITLSMPKCKGRKLEDFNLQLDKETRWFALTDQPVVKALNSYDLVMAVFPGPGKALRRAFIEETLKNKVAVSTITNCLKRSIELGRVTQPRRGEYMLAEELLSLPTSIEQCQT